MKYEDDSNKPSVDLVMHVFLGAVFLAATVAAVDWPQIVGSMV